ncbi:MAG: hypothetical protein GKS06_11345 [Acidobacteria bacterium]|nr:hypothetical protein [Acidobacteriota bacterium]
MHFRTPLLVRVLALFLIVVAWTPSATGQESDALEANGALRVFLDCDRGCDRDFIRQNIDFINWVRDRRDAQVHLLVTRQGTGGGTEFQLEFIGTEDFEGQDQTLLFASSSTDTDDERRRGFARTIRLGLARYIAQTPMAIYADLEFTPPRDENGDTVIAATPESDPWNFWVFSVGLNGNFRGEDRFSGEEFEAEVDASRTTEAWKIRLDSEMEYEQRDFEFDDGSVFKDISRSFETGGQAIKSLGDHWGAGLGASVKESTFFNLAPSYRLAGAVEYNIYPYSVSSQRQLTFTYFLGGNRFNYDEETIFNKTEETLIDQGLIASLDVERPWGSANINLEATHFLQHPEDYNIDLNGRVEYRVLRGLNLNVFGSVSSIKSQRFLPIGGASDEEVLLERRALATDFRFRVGLGIRYTFGSIYNNVVNSRLGGRRGGFHEIF